MSYQISSEQIDEINRLSCQIKGIGATLEGAYTDPSGNAQEVLDDHTLLARGMLVNEAGGSHWQSCCWHFKGAGCR